MTIMKLAHIFASAVKPHYLGNLSLLFHLLAFSTVQQVCLTNKSYFWFAAQRPNMTGIVTDI